MNFHSIFPFCLDFCILLSGINSITNKIGSGATIITNITVLFSAVCLSGPMRLTGKISSVLCTFYPNRC